MRGPAVVDGAGVVRVSKPTMNEERLTMKRKLLSTLLAAAFGMAAGAAQAQISDGVIKIGVMNDMSGVYADIGGPGSVLAARMAVEDFGASAKGTTVPGACRSNKAGIATFSPCDA